MYVWIVETSGKQRYVDDRYISPCYTCGERISICQQNNCLDGPDEPEECATCNSAPCACDAMYEAYKESKLD